MAARKRTSTARASALVDGMFTTAPQNRTLAQKLEVEGEARSTTKPGRRKPADEKKGEAKKEPDALAQRAAAAFTGARKAASVIDVDNLPVMNAPWMRIQETTFELEDPEAEHEELLEALRLTSALTPGNLEAALNDAEDNARRAHKLYIVARVDYERFDLEMTPVVEAMRDAANRELQAEKDAKQRSKAITDADIKGRASILFPDEWALVQKRRTEAEAMMDTLKHFADLWKQRCYSLSTMLNAGKRG